MTKKNIAAVYLGRRSAKKRHKGLKKSEISEHYRQIGRNGLISQGKKLSTDEPTSST